MFFPARRKGARESDATLFFPGDSSSKKKFSLVTLGSGYHRIPFLLHHLKTFSRLSALVFLPGKEGHCSFFLFSSSSSALPFRKGERGRRREGGIFFQPFLRDASQFARGENGHPPRSQEDAPPLPKVKAAQEKGYGAPPLPHSQVAAGGEQRPRVR